jgi:hypothetical protein
MAPEEFIKTGERLISVGAEETEQRSAISRSYYGAFDGCLASLPDQFSPTREAVNGSTSHKAVLNALSNWGNSLSAGRTQAQQAGRRLTALKRARKRADYDINGTLSATDLQNCIADARDVLVRVTAAQSQFERSVMAKEA